MTTFGFFANILLFVLATAACRFIPKLIALLLPTNKQVQDNVTAVVVSAAILYSAWRFVLLPLLMMLPTWMR